MSGVSTSPVILIENNASWYNGVLDAQVFGSGFTLIQNNNSIATNLSASGRLTFETWTGTITLGAGSGSAPQFFFTGDIRSNGSNVVAGSLLRCRAMVNGDTGSAAPIGAERTSAQAMTMGSNTLVTHPFLAGCTRKVIAVERYQL